MKFIEKEIKFPQLTDEHIWLVDEIKNKNETFKTQYLYRAIEKIVPQIIEIKRDYSLTLRDLEHFFSNVKAVKILDKMASNAVVSIELLRMIDLKELEGMLDYAQKNSNFATNLPNRITYDRIYKKISEKNLISKSTEDYKDFINYVKDYM